MKKRDKEIHIMSKNDLQRLRVLWIMIKLYEQLVADNKDDVVKVDEDFLFQIKQKHKIREFLDLNTKYVSEPEKKRLQEIILHDIEIYFNLFGIENFTMLLANNEMDNEVFCRGLLELNPWWAEESGYDRNIKSKTYFCKMILIEYTYEEVIAFENDIAKLAEELKQDIQRAKKQLLRNAIGIIS